MYMKYSKYIRMLAKKHSEYVTSTVSAKTNLVCTKIIINSYFGPAYSYRYRAFSAREINYVIQVILVHNCRKMKNIAKSILLTWLIFAGMIYTGKICYKFV